MAPEILKYRIKLTIKAIFTVFIAYVIFEPVFFNYKTMGEARFHIEQLADHKFDSRLSCSIEFQRKEKSARTALPIMSMSDFLYENSIDAFQDSTDFFKYLHRDFPAKCRRHSELVDFIFFAELYYYGIYFCKVGPYEAEYAVGAFDPRAPEAPIWGRDQSTCSITIAYGSLHRPIGRSLSMFFGYFESEVY